MSIQDNLKKMFTNEVQTVPWNTDIWGAITMYLPAESCWILEGRLGALSQTYEPREVNSMLRAAVWKLMCRKFHDAEWMPRKCITGIRIWKNRIIEIRANALFHVK